MSAIIEPKSATLRIVSTPTVSVPKASAGEALFQSTIIAAEGEVTFTGSHPAHDWEVGFLQAEWVDTGWLHYRGQHDADGSIFFQRSRPPARPVKACRDVDPATDVFYDPTIGAGLAKIPPHAKFPVKLKVTHSDQPEDSCDLIVTNSLTKKPNFLHEAQLEFHFATILTARDPHGAFHHLKSFYWWVHWQALFRPKTFSTTVTTWHVTPEKRGMGARIGHLIDGGPTDRRFAGILTDLKVPACNALIPLYTNIKPGNPCRRESKVWTNFNVHV